MSGAARPGDRRREGLEELVGRIRAQLIGRALVTGVLWLAVLLAVALGAAWVVSGPEGWGSGSAAPLLLDALVLTLAAAGAAALVRHVRTWTSDARITDRLDRVGGFGRGTARGALELSRGVPPGVSEAMARRSELSVLEALPAESDRLAGPPGQRFRRWGRAAAATLAVVLPALAILASTGGERAATAWSGLLRPTGVLAEEPLPPLGLEPDGGVLPRGSELEVVVRAPGRDRVRLDWQFDGAPSRSEEAEVRGDEARFDLGGLDAPVEYRAEAPDGARSGSVRVVPEDPLLVTDLRLEVLFPPHTGRSPRHFEREAPPLEVPVGTRIRVRGHASRELGSAALRAAPGEGRRAAEGDDDAGARLEVSGDRFAGEWTPRRSGRYAWTLRAPDGSEAATVPPPLELTLVGDSAPRIELTFPGRDTVLPLDRRQPLVIRAEDDHGIGSLELVARRPSEESEPVVRELEVDGHRAAAARPVLDLSGWELLPGDSVRYRARVADNAPDPQTAETREYVLRVPRRNRAARDVEERLRTAAEGVDSLAEEAARAAREARELERRGVEERSQEPAERDLRRRDRERASGGRSGDEPVSFEAREEARRAVERQQELMDRLDSLGANLDEVRRALDEAGLSDPDLRRDLEELRSLAERVAPEEMRERLDEAADRLDEMGRGELEEALERLAGDQEEFRDRIERSLERFRRAATQQEFRSTAREARELAAQESGLAEALEQGGEDREERTDQQDRLAERAEQLRERMKRLEENLERMGEEEARQGVERARSGSEDAARSMERAAGMSRQERPEEAAREARSAAERLQESADGLDRARGEMAEQRRERVREAFERGASEARALARSQGELQERMGERGAAEESDLRGDEAAVAEGLRSLASNLSEPSMLDPESGEAVDEAVEDATESVERALEALEQEGGGRTSPSAASMEAVDALNRLAQAAGEAAAAGGSGSRAGAAPGTREQLRGLARRQESLAEQSGALQPMNLGSESLRGRLREMAGGQESVAGELSELAGDPGAREEALGDLEGMAEEARELSERLEEGRLDAETARRQERLFHRLLDAGRSLETDERSNEREASVADPVSAAEVEPLSVEERGGERFQLPSSELLRSLPPAQRALIVRYFERLNRPGDDDPGEGESR